MANIGIIGSGIAGLQLGLTLQKYGVTTTIYAERTPEQQLGRPLSNLVCRNAPTRARERQLRVNHWDSPIYDMVRLSLSVQGPQTIAFSGQLPAPAQLVDMRIYWARLLEDFASRGGSVVMRTLQTSELDRLATQHDLVVVASGRANLSTIFPRVPEHSPFTCPQRLVIGGLFRGIAYSEPRALEVVINPGHGEMIAAPIYSFEPNLTGIGILINSGGAFEPLRHLKYADDPAAWVNAVLGVLREFGPSIYERVDPDRFDLARPLDLGYAAITPTVRRGYAELPSGRWVMALGDAHVVMDPITGQGANTASHGARVLAEAIRDADRFDRPFCERVEREIAAYAIAVSDAANARLRPPLPHYRQLLGASAKHQALADMYGDGFDHPDRFWAITSSPERTAALLSEFDSRETVPALASWIFGSLSDDGEQPPRYAVG